VETEQPLYFRPVKRPKQKTVIPETLGAVFLAAASLLLKLRNLGHEALTFWDESFHALVARNLLLHPLKPTLIEHPFLAYEPRSWINNHVWLHKPILPLWQIAISYAALGVSTFALRLPSALLSTGAVVLTWLIGRELLDRASGLIGAALLAFSPAIMLLVHGYLFADHVDIALLFWTEAAVYLLVRALRTDSAWFAAGAGVAQGLAFLSKTYPALIVTGLAVVAWLLTRSGPAEGRRLSGRRLLILVLATAATIAPWTAYAWMNYPVEFLHENAYIFSHLSTGIDSWAAPWDRLVFDYSLLLYHAFYTSVLVAALVLLPKAVRERDLALLLLYAWGVGVLIPHLFAVSKTPSATLIGVPPFLLLFGRFVVRAWRGEAGPLAAWVAVAGMTLIFRPEITGWGQGYPDPPLFAGVMRERLWILWPVMGGVAAAAAVMASRKRTAGANLRSLALTFTVAVSLWLGFLQVREAWEVTEENRDTPTFAEVAAFARTLPPNAVMLFDESARWGDHQLAEFLSYRTSYGFEGGAWKGMAREVRSKGGVPYVVSPSPLPLPAVFRSDRDNRTVYRVP
jgi:4-amino-4-deoxy-L-arabinose transferase-like glycosyltransferase